MIQKDFARAGRDISGLLLAAFGPCTRNVDTTVGHEVLPLFGYARQHIKVHSHPTSAELRTFSLVNICCKPVVAYDEWVLPYPRRTTTRERGYLWIVER